MARTSSTKPAVSADLVAQVTAAVLAAMEAPAEKPAAKRSTRSSGKPAASPVARRVKPENEDRAASGKAVQGAFFEAFQVIYGEKLTGWPTMGDIQAIRDDLQQRIAAQ